MRTELERKEILFCNLIVIKGKKNIKIEKCVILKGDTIYKRQNIKSIEVIRSLGFQNKSTGFIETKKSEEKRDSTGTYN